jgi:hypothetical protein
MVLWSPVKIAIVEENQAVVTIAAVMPKRANSRTTPSAMTRTTTVAVNASSPLPTLSAGPVPVNVTRRRSVTENLALAQQMRMKKTEVPAVMDSSVPVASVRVEIANVAL